MTTRRCFAGEYRFWDCNLARLFDIFIANFSIGAGGFAITPRPHVGCAASGLWN